MGKVLKSRYELLTELGHGGMSTVYLARDLNLGSYWAVKHMKNNGSNEIVAFKQEVELLAGLSHPDIPRIVDRIEEYDDYYVVMDFVDGVSLGKKIISEGPADEDTVIGWSKMLCSILSYLHTVHDNPIVYRDMKPDNIILAQSGRVKLIDFGIAKECIRGVKDTGECFGTRGYAAPEQYKSGSNILDERTDVYSLGCTMFYLLTGKLPGKAPNACPPLRTINSDLSDGIQYIVAKATNDDPNERYANCDEMYEDLEHIGELSSEYKDKMRKRVLSFVLCIIASLIFAGVGIWGYIRIENHKVDTYSATYRNAMKLEEDGDILNAIEEYHDAIRIDGSHYDTYERWFNVMLPRANDEDFKGKTKSAIDQLSIYIDTEGSDMYNDPRLMFLVAKKCVEVDEVSYAQKATDYLTRIKEDKNYLDGTYIFANLEEYLVIARYKGSSQSGMDINAFAQSLNDLENSTKEGNLSAEDALQNYYTLILMYYDYRTNLNDAYEKIQELGLTAMELAAQNMEQEDFTFNSIAPMYQNLISANYSAAIAKIDASSQVDYYMRTIEWFDKYEEQYIVSDNELLIKEANSYERIFYYRTSSKDLGMATEEELEYIRNAIKIYNRILQSDSSYSFCDAKLGIAYAELAYGTGAESDRNTAVENYYRLYGLREDPDYINDSNTQSTISKLKSALENYGWIQKEK